MLSPTALARLCRARDRLQTELEPPLRVAQLAREAQLSTPHFIALFSAVFGHTPLQWRARARMERARELLLSSDEPITQIALSLGFANAGSFSRDFARHAGVSPRVFRRTAQPVGSPAGCVALMNAALARPEFRRSRL